MRFPYVRYGRFDRTIVPVTLGFGGRTIRHEVLLDTGADISVVHGELAEALAIARTDDSMVELAGIGGKTHGFLVELELSVADFEFSSVPIIFSDGLGPEMYGILGHQGVFDQLRLIFDFGKREFEILPRRKRQ